MSASTRSTGTVLPVLRHGTQYIGLLEKSVPMRPFQGIRPNAVTDTVPRACSTCTFSNNHVNIPAQNHRQNTSLNDSAMGPCHEEFAERSTGAYPCREYLGSLNALSKPELLGGCATRWSLRLGFEPHHMGLTGRFQAPPDQPYSHGSNPTTWAFLFRV